MANLQMVNVLCVCVMITVLFYTIAWIYPTGTNMPKPGIQHQWISILWLDGDKRRLGNELFCFASLLGISKQNNLSLVISKNMKINHIFKLNVSSVGQQQHFLSPYHLVIERKSYDCKYDEQVVSSVGRIQSNIALDGYFQSWKYFQHVTSILRQQLVFQDHIMEEAKMFLTNSIVSFTKHENNGKPLIIAIHIRRGDMLTQKEFNKYGYTAPSADYFRNAIHYFTRKYSNYELYFIVFSNDMTWAKTNLQELHDNLIFSSMSDEVDFALISLCDHTIVSTGSFGWWGAWLSNGTTIYYKNWPKKHSFLDRVVKKEDYFPPRWIGME